MSIKTEKECIMEDFNEYVKHGEDNGRKGFGTNGNGFGGAGGSYGAAGAEDIFGFVKNVSQRFDGKNQKDLMRAIYEEARKGKESGRLTNADIDRFAVMLSPILDDKKRKYLYKIVERLKEIPDA